MKPPRLSVALFVAILFASALAFVPAGAAARATSVACGQVITTNTALTGNLNCTGRGLTLLGQGAVLDLNGYTISGSGSEFGIFLTGDPLIDSVTIKNGTIQGFGVGINGGPTAAGGLSPSFYNVTLSGLTVRNNSIGIRTSLRALIVNSLVTRNSHEGVELAISRNNLVTGNLFSENGGNGLLARLYNDGSDYIHNTFKDNRANGLFIIASTSTVVSNYAVGNKLDGIFLFNTLQDYLSPFYVIARNVANSNGRLGIEACTFIFPIDGCAPGMTDGGGNKANFNGDYRQCLNVVCARH